MTKDLGAATAIGSIVSVWTPASGKKVQLKGMTISVSAAVSVLFEDNEAGAGFFVCRTPKLLADTPYTIFFQDPITLRADDRALKATGSGAANITGTLFGNEVN